jgi:hypothetical protein
MDWGRSPRRTRASSSRYRWAEWNRANSLLILPRTPSCCVGKGSRASCGSTVFGMYLRTGHLVSTAEDNIVGADGEPHDLPGLCPSRSLQTDSRPRRSRPGEWPDTYRPRSLFRDSRQQPPQCRARRTWDRTYLGKGRETVRRYRAASAPAHLRLHPLRRLLASGSVLTG